MRRVYVRNRHISGFKRHCSTQQCQDGGMCMSSCVKKAVCACLHWLVPEAGAQVLLVDAWENHECCGFEILDV